MSSFLAAIALVGSLVATVAPVDARPESVDIALQGADEELQEEPVAVSLGRSARRLHMRRMRTGRSQGDEGDEGNEGDEGDEGNEGNEGDEGNEGNEGNEGDEGNEGNEGDEGDEGNEGKGKKPTLPSKVRGKYQVCVKGKRQGFGVVSGVRKPDGITVHADGRCVFSEYAGGFDGFWSTDAGDGHEDGLALAAKRMLGDKKARVGETAGRKNPVNRFVNQFLQEVRDRAMPVDLDHPRDEGIADGGKRVENIELASAACTDLIQVHRC